MKITIDFKNEIISVEDKDLLGSTIEQIIDDLIKRYFPFRRIPNA